MLSWAAPDNPVLTDELSAKWVRQTLDAVGARTYDELTKERDARVLDLLKIKQGSAEEDTQGQGKTA